MFQHNSFQPLSFSTLAFKMATDETPSRSGYYRLQLHNMQKEYLDKLAEAETLTNAVDKGNEERVPKIVKPKREPKQKQAPIKEKSAPVPIIPFRKLPTKLEPTAYDELAKLPPLGLEIFIQQFTATIIQIDDEREKRRKHRRKVAAFLLMAA